jgi:site-specific recombinase XerD
MANQNPYSSFLTYLRNERVSHRTASGYCSDIRKFCRDRNLSLAGLSSDAFKGITPFDIETHLNSLSARGARAATLKRSLAGIRRFFAYLLVQGMVQANPADEVVLSVTDDRALNQEQVLSIFRFLRLRSREVSPRIALRDELILMFLIFVGLRRDHIPLLKVQSLEPSNGTLRLRVDGHTSVTVDGPVQGHLHMYFKRYPSRSGFLFTNDTGGRGLSAAALRKLLGEISKGLAMDLRHPCLHKTHLWLATNPESANILLARIEDIHE